MDLQAMLAYCGYLIWLLAGTGDFACHRRTDLPRTSGVAESFAHLLQLALLGGAIFVWLAFEVGRDALLMMAACVVVHAVVGYRDTRIAFARRRVVSPIEQHLHSVLDMAPFIAFGWIAWTAWPVHGEPGLTLRTPALPAWTWIAILLPAIVLVVVPAMMEFRSALRVRAQVDPVLGERSREGGH
ncbi:hypothetical protein LK996_09715 [Lysobacter sp. A6]|uniref:Diguanylate cyclase n=1 Tax=Noviluteimonas lactosilytica TaxID=2888523 RepID=A0ABS8JIE0_9GAMM|nr:hypothetical protein [Lysobacter lactosilyticus]MCC8363347.1 hypothetical protein [Lysobacter lactosilyticus]